MKKMDLYAGLLFTWYMPLRWFLLPIINPASQEWGTNIGGNVMAIISALYLAYSIIRTNPQQDKLFFAVTSILWAFNVYCLVLMTHICIADFSTSNFGSEMLDISILGYYTIAMKLCLETVFNKTAERLINIEV